MRNFEYNFEISMKNIRAFLVDDRLEFIESLSLLLEKHCPAVEIVGSALLANDAKPQILSLKPNLLFLDVNMPGKTGFQLLSELGPNDLHIIFCTAFDEYAIKAIKISAFDFLMKPIKVTELMDSVERLSTHIERTQVGVRQELLLRASSASSEVGKIVIPSMTGFYILKYAEIMYLAANGSYCDFHLASGEKIISSRGLYYYNDLLGAPFLRIHNSYTINLDHLSQLDRSVDYTAVLSNGDRLPVSRRKKDEILDYLKKITS